MLAIQLREQVELPSLIGRADDWVLNVGDQLGDVRLARVEVRPLIDARQERAAPIRRIGHGQAGTERHKARQVLVLAAESVRQPRAIAGARQTLVSGVHQPHALFVVRRVGVHRANHADAIRMTARGLVKDFAAPQAAVAVLSELERRGQRHTGLSFGRQVAERQLLAAPFREFRFWIPGIDLRRASVQINVNEMLGSRREVRTAHGQRIGRRRPIGLQQRRQREQAQSRPRCAEQVAT